MYVGQSPVAERLQDTAAPPRQPSMQHVRIQGSQLEVVRGAGPPVLLPAAGLPSLLPLHAVRAAGRQWEPSAAIPLPVRLPAVIGNTCTICGGSGAVVSMYHEWSGGPRLPLPEKVWRWCVFLGSPFWSTGGGRLCPPCHALVHCVESLQVEARLLERVAAEAAVEAAAPTAAEAVARRFRAAMVASGVGATRALLRSVEGLLARQEMPRRPAEPPPPPPPPPAPPLPAPPPQQQPQQQQPQQQQPQQQQQQQQQQLQDEIQDITPGQERRRRASESRPYLQPQLTPLRRGSKRKQKAPCRLSGAAAGTESEQGPPTAAADSVATAPGPPTSTPDPPTIVPSPPSNTPVPITTSPDCLSTAQVPVISALSPLTPVSRPPASAPGPLASSSDPVLSLPAATAAESKNDHPTLAIHQHIVFGGLHPIPTVDLSAQQESPVSPGPAGHPPVTGWYSPVSPDDRPDDGRRRGVAADGGTVATSGSTEETGYSASVSRESKPAPLLDISDSDGAVMVRAPLPFRGSCWQENASNTASGSETGSYDVTERDVAVNQPRFSSPVKTAGPIDHSPSVFPVTCDSQLPDRSSVVSPTSVHSRRPHGTPGDKKRRRKGLKLTIVREVDCWQRGSPDPTDSRGAAQQRARPVQPGGDGGAACKRQLRQLRQHLPGCSDASDAALEEGWDSSGGAESCVAPEGSLLQTAPPSGAGRAESAAADGDLSVHSAAPCRQTDDVPCDTLALQLRVGSPSVCADPKHGHGSVRERCALNAPTAAALPGFQPVPVMASIYTAGSMPVVQSAGPGSSAPAPVRAGEAHDSSSPAVSCATVADLEGDVRELGLPDDSLARGAPPAVTAHILLPAGVEQIEQLAPPTGPLGCEPEGHDAVSPVPVTDSGTGRQDSALSPQVITLLGHQSAVQTPSARQKHGPGKNDTADWPAAVSPPAEQPPNSRRTCAGCERGGPGADDCMASSESPATSTVHLDHTTDTDDVDVNNNVLACGASDHIKSMTGTAARTGPELASGTGTRDPPAGPCPPGGEGKVITAPTQSPLVVDGDIGRVFLSANRALYGCDENDAAEASTARAAASDADDDDEGRLFIALEPLSPDGQRFVTLAAARPSPARQRSAVTASGSVTGPSDTQRRGPAVPRPGRRRVREQDKPLECGKCGRRFILKKMLENHKCGVMYTCSECDKPFKKRCQLQAHSFIHKQAKDFVCSICQRAFKEKSNFNRHVRTHSSLRPYKCPHCVKCFKVAATLYVHRLTHDARGRFVCDFCGKDFKRPEHLRQHRRIHTGEKPYRCTVCQQCFTTDNTLRTHMRRHTGERPYPCPICQKRFTQSSAMKTHWKRHSESREFDCPVCHLKFKQKYDLNRHMVSHNTERPHQCGVCHFRFKTRSSLQKHRETHTEGRQFACGTCGKAFRRLSYLRLHEATHGASTRFACTHCAKSFTRRYNLRLHQEEHEEGGRRRHFCSVCRRCFRRAAGLRQHMVTAHGEPPPSTVHEEPRQDAAVGVAREETAASVSETEQKPSAQPTGEARSVRLLEQPDWGQAQDSGQEGTERPNWSKGQNREEDTRVRQLVVKKEEEPSDEEELVVD